MRISIPQIMIICALGGVATSVLHGDDVWERLEQQQKQIDRLQQQLGEHEQSLRRLPDVDEPVPSFDYASHHELHGGRPCDCPTHYVGYQRGFFLRPFDPDAMPFELRVNGRIQLRHTALDRQADTFFNRATGEFVPIESRNDFEIERGRLTFSGFVHDPSLQFFINMDLDTDDNHRAVAQDFWFNYEFSDALNVYVGKAFIPGSRDWLDGALRLRFGDRSMATTFFRPDRTIGIWAIGNLTDNWKYRTMVGNGFQTSDLRTNQIDDRLMFSTSTWWDLGAPFGPGRSDLQWHEEPAMRIGSAFTFASQESDEAGASLTEQAFVRLSDGVRLTDTGALAPGVRVNNFDIYLLSADIAGKYRGWSFNGEFFARWLNSLSATGPLPLAEIYTDGFFFETGYMLCPESTELMARISTVDGLFGDAWEYAIGVNFFFNGHNNKLTFDATYVDGVPVSNTGANYRVGDRGVMFRSAWQFAF